MKKFTGNYTNEATKTLKNSERVICRTMEDGTIYICNGFILCKMNPLEYAAVVQPFSLCEPGNWVIDKDGKRDDLSFDAEKLFSGAVKEAENAGRLERCPLDLETGKATACCYYNADKKFASFYNIKFVASFRPGALLRCPGPLSAAVAYDGNEPFAMMLPIKPEEKASRAVMAYFAQASNETNAADLALARKENAQQAEELEALRAKVAELEAQQAQPQEAAAPVQQPAQADSKTAAEVIASRFADMAGVTTTIKGAQTAAPVIWLAGNTEEHAEAIKAAGGKWSNKKSAFYVRVA